MIADANPGLIFGSLELATADGAAGPFEVYALGSDWDTTWGNPDPVQTVVESLLGDGSLVTIERDENRDAVIGIAVSGENGFALAEAEARLVEETRKQNTLMWTPPDGWGPPSIFDVMTSWLEHVFDDIHENQLRRRYRLHLALYPHARSEAVTVVPAVGSGVTPGGAPTEVLVTDCGTTTGWSSPLVASIITEFDYVKQAGSTSDGREDMYFDSGSTNNRSATPLLVVDYYSANKGQYAPRAFLPTGFDTTGREVPLVSISASPPAIGTNLAWRRAIYDASAFAASVRWFRFLGECPTGYHATDSMRISRVGFSDGNATYSGTTRQLERTLEVGGSERAPATLQVSHTTSALGDVLIWTGPQAAMVPLRAARISGAGATADSTTVSGALEAIDSVSFVADVPITSVPAGTYAVVVRARTASSPGARTILVQSNTRTEFNGGSAVGATASFSGSFTTVDTTLGLHHLGTTALPVTESLSANAAVRINLSATGGTTTIDEAWLINVTDGVLTWLPGVTEKNVWLDPPSVDQPRPRVWAGPSADKSDAYDITATAAAWDVHRFEPGTWSVFTVTTTAENAAVSASYSQRWHTHAAD